jgi:hypothetical protein
VDPNEVCRFCDVLSIRLVDHPHLEVDIVFGRPDRHSTEPASPYLTIAMLSSASSSITAAGNTPNPARANVDGPVAEGSTARFADQVNDETVPPTVVATPLSPVSQTNYLAMESDTAVGPVASSQTEVSQTALRRTEEAIDTMRTWSGAVESIKRVMDAVSPIAEV